MAVLGRLARLWRSRAAEARGGIGRLGYPNPDIWYTLGGMKRLPRSLALTVCAIGLVLPGALTGCGSDSTAAAAEPEAQIQQSVPGRIAVGEFAAVIARPGVQIIDVRTPEEFSAGHIAGAVNIPVQDPAFSERIGELDPAGTYAVYCRSGNRSKPAVSAMKDAGLTDIYELASGTNGWVSADQLLVQ